VKNFSARDAAENLVRHARERAQGHGDNLSVAIVKLDAPEKPSRALPPERASTRVRSRAASRRPRRLAAAPDRSSANAGK
jgi:serine/threonine protein phosphatase PrpC